MYWNINIRRAVLVALLTAAGAGAWYLDGALGPLRFTDCLCSRHISDVAHPCGPGGYAPRPGDRAHQVVPAFPWPPPGASAKAEIPRGFFLESSINRALRESGDDILLYDVYNQILVALINAGYEDCACYAVPDGFALATRMEAVNTDGTPRQGAYRWATGSFHAPAFTLESCIEATRTCNRGMFRMIVFIVTPHRPGKAGPVIDARQERIWLDRGFNILPDPLCELPYTEQYTCTALIYEFVKSEPGKQARLSVPGNLSGRKHLVKSALWGSLQQLWTLAAN